MDALLLAAGLGTRLGPLTQNTPKALIPVAGVPILERVARSLVAAGVDRLIINTHHLAEQIVDFVRDRRNFGVEVLFSHEAGAPLETGGAVKLAAPLFRGDAPFFIHNADVLTDLPLPLLYERHREHAPLATLAVMTRATSRYLLFDDEGLIGRADETKGLRLEVRAPAGDVRPQAFAGMHVVSPEFLPLLTEGGVFSILDPYLRLASQGHRIIPFDCTGYDWIDIGKPEQLARANLRLAAP